MALIDVPEENPSGSGVIVVLDMFPEKKMLLGETRQGRCTFFLSQAVEEKKTPAVRLGSGFGAQDLLCLVH